MRTAEIINIGEYLPVIAPPDLPDDDYADFMEDLHQLGMSVKDLAEEMGVSAGTIYAWKRNGVPMYAHKFLDMVMRLHDAEIRLGKREP